MRNLPMCAPCSGGPVSLRAGMATVVPIRMIQRDPIRSVRTYPARQETGPPGGVIFHTSGTFPNHDAPTREKVASFLTPAIGTVTRLSLFQAGSFS
jgi:hypothetical protein